jgi:phosphatidylserine/phosphatidylglycerophosphate/cardiolipin synthase-like enzyme
MPRELAQRRVHLVAMPHSLGVTDESAVHLGHCKYREDVLDLGMDLCGASSARTQHNVRHKLFVASVGRLHSQVAVVDRRMVYMGSMNLDPRSDTINTELGAGIEDDQEVLYEEEPEVSLRLRFKIFMLQPLVPGALLQSRTHPCISRARPVGGSSPE